MTKALTGGCGCGAVRFEIAAPIRVAVNCHCDSCRTYNGAAFSTYCVVAQTDVKVTAGQEHVAGFDRVDGGSKQFCAKCASPLFNAHPRYPGMYMVYLGSLTESATITPSLNVYCENKLPWVDSLASIKSFEQSVER